MSVASVRFGIDQELRAVIVMMDVEEVKVTVCTASTRVTNVDDTAAFTIWTLAEWLTKSAPHFRTSHIKDDVESSIDLDFHMDTCHAMHTAYRT